MFLEYGLNKYNEMVHIDHVASGRVSLKCPYCGQGLLAKKGQQIAHHFAHDGETCREVTGEREAIQLPVYDQFGLNLGTAVWGYLQQLHEGRRYLPQQATTTLERLELAKYNHFKREWELTHLGRIPFGETTLSTFADLQRGLFEKKHAQLEQALFHVRDTAALADLQMYRAQLQRVFSTALYFLEIKHTGGKLYKIGVTGRELFERTAELEHYLTAQLGKVSIKPLRVLNNQGSLEHYFKHRYKDHATSMGIYTEYFDFPNRRKVLSDLTRLGDRELTSLEQSILQGELSGTAVKLQAQFKEEERREAIREGMAAAAAEGKHVGRPIGSNEEEEAFLAKYPEVVQALEQGLSLRRVAATADVSINTVRKVKSCLQNQPY